MVVFISSFGQVNNQTVILSILDSNFTAWKEFILDHPVSCYHQVLAFDIEADGSISGLAAVDTVTGQLAPPCPFVSQGNFLINSL